MLAREHWGRVPELTAGERSGLFAMEDALYGCYLRVGDPVLFAPSVTPRAERRGRPDGTAVAGPPWQTRRPPPSPSPLLRPIPGGACRHRAAYADVPRRGPNGAGSLRWWRCWRARRFP